MWFPLDNVTSEVAITSDVWINASYTTVIHYQFIWHTDESRTFLFPQANLTEVLSLTFSTKCASQDIIFTINLNIILLKKFSEPLIKKIKFYLKSRKEKRCYNIIDGNINQTEDSVLNLYWVHISSDGIINFICHRKCDHASDLILDNLRHHNPEGKEGGTLLMGKVNGFTENLSADFMWVREAYDSFGHLGWGCDSPGWATLICVYFVSLWACLNWFCQAGEVMPSSPSLY